MFNLIRRLSAGSLVYILSILLSAQPAATNLSVVSPAKVILDTDIGDDIDDAFALALALRSPELNILGITTAWGDTKLRARMVDRFLMEVGRSEIPVAEGIVTKSAIPFTQAKWADAGPKGRSHPPAIDFILRQIRKYPAEVTLICIGPLTNIGAVIARDPDTFHKVKRVVLMGGSVRRGYGDLGYTAPHGPDPEYNIISDIPAAKALFGSGVPIAVMPVDSTQLFFDAVKQQILFRQSTPLTDALTLLYHQWGQQTPTLFDAMAVAYEVQPSLCPTRTLHIVVDDKGYTREAPGTANAEVCLDSSSDRFFTFFMQRVLESSPTSYDLRK
jgi:inosine-uridine nucleoside N-ribohydrolase